MIEIKQFYSQNFDPIKRKKRKHKICGFSLYWDEIGKVST